MVYRFLSSFFFYIACCLNRFHYYSNVSFGSSFLFRKKNLKLKDFVFFKELNKCTGKNEYTLSFKYITMANQITYIHITV